MKCVQCGSAISPERLEALPETKVCVGCSLERPKTSDDIDMDDEHEPGELYRTISHTGE